MLNFGVEIPFVNHLGFAMVRMQDGESELHYAPRPEHLNSFGVTHGGASMTLLDVAMATAASSVGLDTGVVTIEMKTTFMQAAHGPMVAKGRLVHRTASMAFTEATVFDAAGSPCTHATGTFKYVQRLPKTQDPSQGRRGAATPKTSAPAEDKNFRPNEPLALDGPA